MLRRAGGAGVQVLGAVSTALRAEESLAAAATRAVHAPDGPAADVWAVDLSGPDACFAVDVLGSRGSRPVGSAAGWEPKVAAIPWVTIAFRPMTRADLPDVVTWQSRPHVARWWSDEASDVAGAEAHYGPALDGDDPTRMWVLEVNGRSVGMLQDYLVGDHADWSLLTAKPDAVGFDYLIGDPGWVGSGVGTRMLWTYLRDVVRPHYPRGARAVRGARPPQRRVAPGARQARVRPRPVVRRAPARRPRRHRGRLHPRRGPDPRVVTRR